MVKQIKSFKSTNFEELINQINLFNQSNESFSTQIFCNQNIWFAAVYFEERVKDITKEVKKSTPIAPSSVIIDSERITEKQKNFLIKNGWKGELPKTKEEARQIIDTYIKNLKKEEI